MKILIVGSGGREHAIAYYLNRSRIKPQLYAARGNAGMTFVRRLDIDETDISGLLTFAQKEKMDLTIVGPELPLSMGIVNVFRENNLCIFGPTKEAAIIETSKEYAKEIMKKYHISTASYQTVSTYDEARKILDKNNYPIVLKYDGLAAGKGVVVATNKKESDEFLKDVFIDKKFGTGNMIIEEFLSGSEFSLMAFVNGRKVYPMAVAQDHKRAYDGNRGPNTGGMGAYSPVPFINENDIRYAVDAIMKPTAEALCKEGRPFTGILYGGLIKTAAGIKVIEFNARFGDPETEVVLPRLKNDLLQVIIDVMAGKDINLDWYNDIVVGVVMAAVGYPGGYSRGADIENIPKQDVFHMGTALKDGKIINSGGRTLIAIGRGMTFSLAREKAYKKASMVKGQLFYRHDIGYQALETKNTEVNK